MTDTDVGDHSNSRENRIRRMLFLQSLRESSDEDLPGGSAAEDYLAAQSERNETSADALLDEYGRLTERELNRRWDITLKPFYAAGSTTGILTLVAFGLLSFIFGAAATMIGGGVVNILINPFIILLLWHLITYTAVIIYSVISWTPDSLIEGVHDGPFRRLFSAVLSGIDSFLRRHTTNRKARGYRRVLQAQPQFRTHTLRELGSLSAARLAVRLNLLSMLTTGGVLAGMYLSGLVRSYSFVWESTFITSPQVVEAIIGTLFYPVFLLFGISMPPIAGAGQPVAGAPWIHLFALATLIYVILPRGILAAINAFRARSISARLAYPLHIGLARDVLQKVKGAGLRVQTLFYSYQPDDDRMQALARELGRHYGQPIEMDQPQHISWGDDPTRIHIPEEVSDSVLLFNAARTPEFNVQGLFMEGLQEIMPEKNTLHVCIDLQALADLPEEQLEERKDVWKQILSRAGVQSWQFIHLSSQGDSA